MSMKWAEIPEGVVHPHIDRPEFRLDVLGCGRHLGAAGNVQWQGERALAKRLHLVRSPPDPHCRVRTELGPHHGERTPWQWRGQCRLKRR
jgi:hypothetical protein